MSFPLFRSRPTLQRVNPPSVIGDPLPSKRHSSYLTSDCDLQGRVSFFRDARIDGRVEGDVAAAKSLTVGLHGEVYADIESDSVVIAGRVEGNVVAKSRIRLTATAYIVGDLETAGIAIEEGARVDGKIVIRPRNEEDVWLTGRRQLSHGAPPGSSRPERQPSRRVSIPGVPRVTGSSRLPD